MTNQEIYELIACFDRSTIQEMKLAKNDFSIELSRGTVQVQESVAVPASTSAVEPNHEAEKLISAPLVGTYHASPAPGKAPFVVEGDRVNKGCPVCLIEAMKMMSEITAPCDCVIEQLMQQDGKLVAFDAPLFRYREIASC